MIESWRGEVKPEWIDYNGHLNEGYYAVIFSDATDGVMNHIGLDHAYREATRNTLYTLETRIRYIKEVHVGRPLVARSRIVGFDAKRMVVYSSLFEEASGDLLAIQEALSIAVSQADGVKVIPWPEEIRARMLVAAREDAGQPLPEDVGRGLTVLGLPED